MSCQSFSLSLTRCVYSKSKEDPPARQPSNTYTGYEAICAPSSFQVLQHMRESAVLLLLPFLLFRHTHLTPCVKHQPGATGWKGRDKTNKQETFISQKGTNLRFLKKILCFLPFTVILTRFQKISDFAVFV